MQPRSLQDKLYPYLYIIPALVLTVLVTLFPIFYSMYLAFTNYSLYHFKDFQFVGLKNFIDILTTSELNTFLSVFLWTFLWSLLSVITQLGAGLSLALLLNNSKLTLSKLYRTLLIIPWALPSFISILVWAGIMNSDKFGPMNLLLKVIGLPIVPWLDDPFWAKFSVLLVNLWLGFPFMMSISLGALQSIPSELYEAASVDGATKIEQFFAITMPLLRSALLPVLITSFAFAFNNFVGIYLLTGGGPPVAGSPAGATDILVSYTYKLAFTMSRYGLACAYAILIFIMIGSLSLVNFKLTGAFKET